MVMAHNNDESGEKMAGDFCGINCSRVFNEPKMLITYVWFTTLIFVFCFCIAAMVMAHNNDESGAGNKSDGFAAIWTMLLIVALSIGGTMVMRKYQTPLAVGFFLGVCVMMSINMFSLFVLFLGAAYLEDKVAKRTGDVKTRENAASTASS